MRSIGFLNREYRHNVWYCFYWEVFELVRKLWLTGFVFLVPQSLTLIRLLTSILVTVGHIVVLQRTQPYAQQSTMFVAVSSGVIRAFRSGSAWEQTGL